MSETRSLDEEAIHDVLRNRRRRLTLEQLRENGCRLPVRELAEQVAALETGESPPPRNIRQSVYVSLHQTHLPKLDGLGIVDYDADAKEVSLTDRVHELDAYTRSLSDERDQFWPWYYIAVSGVGLVAMLAVGFGTPVLTPVGAPAIATILFIAVLVLSACQLRSPH